MEEAEDEGESKSAKRIKRNKIKQQNILEEVVEKVDTDVVKEAVEKVNTDVVEEWAHYDS